MQKKREGFRISIEDQVFFRQFYEDYKGFIFFTARKIVSSEEDCEDIVQDAVIRLMKNIPTLRELNDSKTAKYIAVTIKSAFFDREKKKRHKAVPIPQDYPDLLNSVEKMEGGLDAQRGTEFLKNALSEREWLLLEGKYIVGYSQEELSSLINCSPDSVRMLLSRTRKKARSIMAKIMEERTDANGF